jgi:polar amino acid transport system substrate-binding protein
MKSNLVFLITLLFACLSNAQKTLTLATTNWCPYTCDFNGNTHGLVGEILENVLLAEGINLKIEYYPWSRAIQLANLNKVDGLLTVTREESPDLIFSKSPIGSYQMCFYTKNTNTWLYQADLNLGSNKLAIVQDYGYGEPLDTYINENKNRNLLTISGDDSANRLIQILKLGRADIIIEDNKVVQWSMIKNNVESSNIKKAGCLNEQPFYLALSPNESNRQLMNDLNLSLENVYKKFKSVIDFD